jgi:hypothetical protein
MELLASSSSESEYSVKKDNAGYTDTETTTKQQQECVRTTVNHRSIISTDSEEDRLTMPYISPKSFKDEDSENDKSTVLNVLSSEKMKHEIKQDQNSTNEISEAAYSRTNASLIGGEIPEINSNTSSLPRPLPLRIRSYSFDNVSTENNVNENKLVTESHKKSHNKDILLKMERLDSTSKVLNWLENQTERTNPFYKRSKRVRFQ